MTSRNFPDDWMGIKEAFELFDGDIRSLSAFRYHLGKRAENGLEVRDAVRLSPLGNILVNPARFRAWLVGDGELVPIKKLVIDHAVDPESLRKAVNRQSIPVFERLGATCIRREDVARLLQTETRELDGFDAA